MNPSRFGLLLTVAAGSIIGQPQASRPAVSDQGIVRLSADDFPELPRSVAADLGRRGCSIPQLPMVAGPHNVIKGEFAKPGQTDWAVLCSVRGTSSILVYWNGSAADPTQLAPVQDSDRLQSWTENKMVYSRKIATVDRAFIMEHYRTYGGETPPPIDHHGVDDAFYGKASEVHYLHQGKWLRLTGAD